MHKRFVFEREDLPDKAWLDRFVAGREEAERWYLGRGQAAAPTAAECRAALFNRAVAPTAHGRNGLKADSRACASCATFCREHLQQSPLNARTKLI